MRDYMKGLRQFDVTVTAGMEHTGTTFTDTFVARNSDHAREQAESKWLGAAVGAVVAVKPLTADEKDGGARWEARQNAGLDY